VAAIGFFLHVDCLYIRSRDKPVVENLKLEGFEAMFLGADHIFGLPTSPNDSNQQTKEVLILP